MFQSEKYGVCVYDRVVEEFERFWYLEITDWESVYMLTIQFLEIVIRADKIAVSSDLNEQGQSLTCVWNVYNIELLST